MEAEPTRAISTRTRSASKVGPSASSGSPLSLLPSGKRTRSSSAGSVDPKKKQKGSHHQPSEIETRSSKRGRRRESTGTLLSDKEMSQQHNSSKSTKTRKTAEPIEMEEVVEKEIVDGAEEKAEKDGKKEKGKSEAKSKAKGKGKGKNKGSRPDQLETSTGPGVQSMEEKGDPFGSLLEEHLHDASPGTDRQQALENLLAKMGGVASSFAPNPSLGRSRLNALLQGIKSLDDEAIQLQSLMELCDFLSIGTEDNLANFPIDAFVPALTTLLRMEHNPDMMLLACRALAYLMEALPSSCSSVVSYQAIPLLCDRLLSVEYIDLAEQALQCLEKVSYEHPAAVLKCGGLMAALTYLDFFPTGTQRTAVSTAANVCRQVPQDLFGLVADAIPILTNLIQYQDAKVAEKALICFARLAESFYNFEDKFAALVQHGLLIQVVRLMSGSSSVSPATYVLAVRLLTTMCCGLPALTLVLYEEGIAAIINGILAGAQSNEFGSSGTHVVSTEQVFEILCLINELLPPLPKETGEFLASVPGLKMSFGVVRGSSRMLQTKKLLHSKINELIKRAEGESESEPESEEEEIPHIVGAKQQDEQDPRKKILEERPQLLVNLAESLFPTLMRLYNATVNPSVRHRCLSAVLKLLCFCSPPILEELLRNLSISSFIANLLSSEDTYILSTALKMCNILMSKLSKIFGVYFKREGVVFEIHKLARQTESQTELGVWAQGQAKEILKLYFPKSEYDDDDTSDELRQLKVLSNKLSEMMDSKATAEEERATFESIRDILCQSTNPVSAFEFLRSMLIQNMLNFLTKTSSKSESSDFSDAEKETLLGRAEIFCESLFNLKEASSDTQSVTILLGKLHHALNKEEQFPVLLNEVPGTAASLKFLTQPFKIKLQPEGEAGGETIILVEPLATISAINHYLSSKFVNAKGQKGSLASSTEETVGNPSDSDETEVSHLVRIRMNGEVLGPHLTLFKAIYSKFWKGKEDAALLPAHRLWEQMHTFTYSLNEKGAKEEEETAAESVPTHLPHIHTLEAPYIKFLQEPCCELDCDKSIAATLLFIRVLHELNSNPSFWDKSLNTSKVVAPGRSFFPNVEFVNSKLTAKMMRQLQDPLTLCSSSLPKWCIQLMENFPFLFPFECRKLYFYCTSLGIARALQALQQYVVGTGSELRTNEFKIGRIQRQKVRISRDRILESAQKAMSLYGTSRALLEVEYFGEVGTGLGPTLEFYTLASQELQRRDLLLWRDKEATSPKAEAKSDGKSFVLAPQGLYPAPIKPGEVTEKTLRMFEFIGCFVAKAVLDNRLLDLHLSSPFLKWMVGKPLGLEDLISVDPELGTSLQKLVNICKGKDCEVVDRKAFVQNLDLDFTLPGRPDWHLKEKGESIDVTIDNLEDYINLVVEQHLYKGVEAQLSAFERGFNKVLPMKNIGVLMIDELESMLCGSEHTNWDLTTLLDNTRCDHGYSHQSKTVQHLLEIMTELSPTEQRQFLLFVTGSPKLPIGGFKSLEPKLTIVRRDPGANSPDSYLPSVNCCFYYLKVPEYSSKEILKERLFFAINNGQGSFSFN